MRRACLAGNSSSPNKKFCHYQLTQHQWKDSTSYSFITAFRRRFPHGFNQKRSSSNWSAVITLLSIESTLIQPNNRAVILSDNVCCKNLYENPAKKSKDDCCCAFFWSHFVTLSLRSKEKIILKILALLSAAVPAEITALIYSQSGCQILGKTVWHVFQ